MTETLTSSVLVISAWQGVSHFRVLGLACLTSCVVPGILPSQLYWARGKSETNQSSVVGIHWVAALMPQYLILLRINPASRFTTRSVDALNRLSQ